MVSVGAVDRTSFRTLAGSQAILGRLLGEPRARQLLAHFQEGPKGLTCKYYDQPHLIGPKKYVHAGQRISPIVLGTLEDLAFYDVEGIPEEYKKEGRSLIMSFLEKYLLIPTRTGKFSFVCDDHTHAAFAWALALEAGLIGEKAALIRIDLHEDCDPLLLPYPRSARLTLSELAEYCWGRLEISNFTALLADDFELPSGRVIDHRHIHYVLPWLSGTGVLKHTGYFDSENPITAVQVDGIRTSLEKVPEVIAGLRQEGKSVICDTDLDFFFGFYQPDYRPAFSREETLQRVIEAAHLSDFVTLATSPNYFLAPDQRTETKFLLTRIVEALDR
jgi:hypothetical protein